MSIGQSLQAANEITLSNINSPFEDAVTRIQTAYRCFSARALLTWKKQTLLPGDLFKKALKYIEDKEEIKRMPQAQYGTIPVYLPQHLPVVLKHTNIPFNRFRFEKKEQAVQICLNNRYKHLIIAKARIYGEFLIEARLPIEKIPRIEQIELYVIHFTLFSIPIEEFISFFFQTTLKDVVSRHKKSCICYDPIGRYDNISLYIENDQGKIGLVDLETFHPDASNDLETVLEKCLELTCLFPLHLDRIIAIGRKYCPKIIKHRKLLQKQKIATLKHFENIISNQQALEMIKSILLETK